jgi:hypothetical protein
VIEIDISHNMDIMLSQLKTLRKRDLPAITRQSINKTIGNIRTKTSSSLRQKVNLRAREVKNDYLSIIKAKGSTIPKMSASLVISSRPISLIRFAKDKSIERQGYMAISQRRKIKYTVRKGSSRSRKNLFVAKGKGGNVHMFSRTSTKSNPIKIQRTPSLSHYFENTGIERSIRTHADNRFAINFKAALNNRLRKRGY